MLCGPGDVPVKLPNKRGLSAAALALLIYLRTETGAHDKDKLAELLWGRSGRHSLNNAVYSLRQVLPEDTLVEVQGGLRCIGENLPCDYEDFRSAPNMMDRFRAYRPEFGRVPGLPAAAEAANGYEDWRAVKENDQRRHLDGLWTRAEKRMIEAGAWEDMIDLGVMGLRWDPTSSDAVQLAMRGYGGLGRENRLTALFAGYREDRRAQGRSVPKAVRDTYEAQLARCRAILERGAAAGADAAPGSDLLYIAAPMNSHRSDDEWAAQTARISEIAQRLRSGTPPVEVYHAAESRTDRSDTDDPGHALAVNLDYLRRCSGFVLIYRKDAGPTSALVEAGAALALGRPMLLLFERGAEIPYLLKNVQAAAREARFFQFRNWKEVERYILDDLPSLAAGRRASG